MSCDKILQHDWTALYSAAGQGLYTQFTRPFPLLRKWVWLARLVLDVVIYTNANCTHNIDEWAIRETAELEVVCVVKVRRVCSAVHKGRPCQPCKLSNQSTYFHSGKDASLLECFRLSELSLGSFQTSAYAGHVEMT